MRRGARAARCKRALQVASCGEGLIPSLLIHRIACLCRRSNCSLFVRLTLCVERRREFDQALTATRRQRVSTLSWTQLGRPSAPFLRPVDAPTRVVQNEPRLHLDLRVASWLPTIRKSFRPRARCRARLVVQPAAPRPPRPRSPPSLPSAPSDAPSLINQERGQGAKGG